LRSDKRRPSPITSFDWCSSALNLIACSSYDTLISVWDLNKEALEFQFAGHDRAVNDLSFSPQDPHIFITCSTDGTLRLFDRRHMEYSQQIVEMTQPLLRCGFNHIEPNYIAFVEHESNNLKIVDLRNTS